MPETSSAWLRAAIRICLTPSPMPNQPRDDNPGRTVRIPDDLWARVRARAERDGASASEVVREALRRWLR